MEMSEELNDWITEWSRTSRTELAELDPRETNWLAYDKWGRGGRRQKGRGKGTRITQITDDTKEDSKKLKKKKHDTKWKRLNTEIRMSEWKEYGRRGEECSGNKLEMVRDN